MKNKVQHEYDTLSNKYDSEMHQRQIAMEVIAAQHKEERGRLHELREWFRKIDEEKERIREEERVLEEEKERRALGEKARHAAATKIQSIIKMFLTKRKLKRERSKKAKQTKGKKK